MAERRTMRLKRLRTVPSGSWVAAKSMNGRCTSCCGTALAMRLMQAVDIRVISSNCSDESGLGPAARMQAGRGESSVEKPFVHGAPGVRGSWNDSFTVYFEAAAGGGCHGIVIVESRRGRALVVSSEGREINLRRRHCAGT